MRSARSQYLEQLACRIVAEGKPYRAVEVDEGDAESGPLQYVYHGFRMGAVKVELSPRGNVSLIALSNRDRRACFMYPTLDALLYYGRNAGNLRINRIRAALSELRARDFERGRS